MIGREFKPEKQKIIERLLKSSTDRYYTWTAIMSPENAKMATKSFAKESENMDKTNSYTRKNAVYESLFTLTSFNSYVEKARKREA